MSFNQQCSWHHTCQQRDIVSATSAHLELVPEKAADLELCMVETLRRTQEELLWYRKVYENIPSVYFSLETTGTILSVNQFGAGYLGYTPEELVQKPIFQLFAPSDRQRLANALMGLFRATPPLQVEEGEFRLDCPTSKVEWVKVVARILLPDGEQNPIILMVCEDITEHKQVESWQNEQRHTIADAEVALIESQKVAQAQLEESALNRLKEEFLRNVSYELRTPVTNMKMAIQMLLIALNKEQNFFWEMTLQTKSSKVDRYLQILNNECDREINLINNFLDLQRLDTSNKPLVLETIQVHSWLAQVIKLFNAHNRNCYQYELQLSIDPNLTTLICDPFNLERILIELLTNACKFSPLGERITITAQLKSNNFQLQMTNSGVEIPADELPRIFDKFYRIPSNDPKKQGGTGLGLALVQKLIKHLGGSIKVESRSNFTCFTIELPVRGVGSGE